MDENKLRVQLKPGIAGGEYHTTNFDLVLKRGETAEVSEEQFQRLLLGTEMFEVVGSKKEGEPTAVGRGKAKGESSPPDIP